MVPDAIISMSNVVECPMTAGPRGVGRIVRLWTYAGIPRAAKWPGAAPWSAGCVTGAGRVAWAASEPGAERARRAKPGHFAARRALFLAQRARCLVLRPSRRVDDDVFADDAKGLAEGSQTPMGEAPRQSPPIARSPREPCSGVARRRGRAQFWGRRALGGNVALRRGSRREAAEDARVPAPQHAAQRAGQPQCKHRTGRRA
jgi:hypothetical protein